MITSFLSTVLREGASQFLLDSLVLGASTPIALHKLLSNYCLLCQDSTVHHPPKGRLRSLCHFSGRYREWEKDLPLGCQRPLSIRCHGDTQLLQYSLFSPVVIISIYRPLLYHSCLTNHGYWFPKSWYHQRWLWRNPAWSSYSCSSQCIYPTI